MRIYYKNDFKLRVSFQTPDGRLAAPPVGDVVATLSTSNLGPRYVAERRSTFARDIATEDNYLVVVANDHGLTPGELTLTIDLPIADESYPDGVRNIAIVTPTGVNLTRDHRCAIAPEVINVMVTLPYFIGVSDSKPGGCDCPEYEPFTPEEILDMIDEVVREDANKHA